MAVSRRFPETFELTWELVAPLLGITLGFVVDEESGCSCGCSCCGGNNSSDIIVSFRDLPGWLVSREDPSALGLIRPFLVEVEDFFNKSVDWLVGRDCPEL